MMKRKSLLTAAITLLLLIGHARSGAQTIVYPSTLNTNSIQRYSGYNIDYVGGFFNVKAFGAKGDGVTDDTQAIQAALDASRKGVPTGGKPDYFYPRPKTVYFPKGTYLVSNSFVWIGQAMMLMGQGKGETIIRLKNSAYGFTSASTPKALIKTPEGIHEFRNYIRDMTIDVGSGNAGAIGIDFIANNSGGIVNVEVKSTDGSGNSGISMIRSYPGPLMLKKVSVSGFDYGIKTGKAEYSITFENITLSNQRVAGIENNGNILMIRKLTSTNSVPAVRNLNRNSMITILDSELKGGSGANSGIDIVDGNLFARNITAVGYQSAIKNKGTVVSGTTVQEYVNGTITSLFSSAKRSLNLPIEETPEYHENDPTKWAELSSPAYYGDNSTWANAINSGKPVIYFKTGTYLAYNRTYNVPITVQKFMGFGTVINGGDQFAMKLVVSEGDENSPPLIIEHIGYGITIEHLSKRPVVIKHGIVKYTGSANAGKLYMEDVELKNTLTLNPKQQVWARQLNTELDYGRILNNGANLWILGLKTENRGYVIKTTNCGRTELLGGLIYPVKTFSTSETAFICEEAQQSLIFGATSYSTGKMYPILVRETQNGVVKEMKYGGQIKLFLPLHVGYSTTCSNIGTSPSPAPAPTGIAAGTYKIVAKHSGKALEVAGVSTTSGALAQQWSYLSGANQQWKIEPVDGTYYKLTAVHSGKVLDVKGYSLTDGGTIHQYAWLNADNQKFSIIDVGGGYYKIIGKQSGKALEVYQSSVTDGSKVVQWTYGGGSNQQWKLELVSSTARVTNETRSPEAAAPTLKLSPNPANQAVDIEWRGLDGEGVTIAITNSQGVVVHQEAVNGKTHHRVPTSQLKSGFYFVVLSSPNSVATEKLVISR